MHSEFSPPPFPRSADWCSLVVFSLFPATLRAENEAPRLPSVEVSAARVVSTATRLDEDPLRLPFSTAVVTREEMDNSGARTLEEALRSVPGLQHGTQGNYYTRFETRGLRDTQDVLVLIDGVPLRLLQGNADVTLIAPDLVERIEFVKGPASALYGRNAIGGVAQFFMRPEKEGATVTALARRATPAPMMLPVIVCVVDTGMPSRLAVNTTIEPPVDAAKP